MQTLLTWRRGNIVGLDLTKTEYWTRRKILICPLDHNETRICINTVCLHATPHLITAISSPFLLIDERDQYVSVDVMLILLPSAFHIRRYKKVGLSSQIEIEAEIKQEEECSWLSKIFVFILREKEKYGKEDNKWFCELIEELRALSWPFN